MNRRTVRWLGAALALSLMGLAGMLGHVLFASPLGAMTCLLISAAAILLGLGIGQMAAEANRRRQREIERRNEELSALNAVAATASRSLDLSSVFRDCLDKTLEVMKLDAGAAFLRSDAGSPLLHAHRAMAEDLLARLARMEIDEGAAGPVVIPANRTGFRGKELSAPVSVPLRSEGRVVGAMYLASTSRYTLTPRDIQMLTAIGDVIGMAVRNAKLHAQVQEHATRDALTGLFNRRYFDEVYGQESSRARRYRLPLAMAMIDINHFKEINDRFGHKAGDQALIAVGRVLRSGRASDVAARYGGDEFVVMMPNTSAEGARAVVERIRRAVWAAPLPEPLQSGLELSIGVASSGEGYDRILERADERMYREKHAAQAQAASRATGAA